MPTTTLSGDYGYTSFRYSGGDATVIDASDASWIVANTGSITNRYPFLVEYAKSGLDIFGATFYGTVSQTTDWSDAYINSAALMVRDTQNVSVHDITIDGAWDALRIAGSSDGFEIFNVHVSNTRDDAIENDDGASGTIRDSLFDGVFSGISLGNKNTANSSNEVVEIDNVLMRMESYLYNGEMTHGSPMKMVSNSPSLKITNSVFAIEDPSHIGDWRLDLAWDKTIESSGNVFLNLSDKPFPSGYPMPGSGWTVLQGQAARDYWEDARDEWLAIHDSGGDFPDTPDPTPVDEPDAPDVGSGTLSGLVDDVFVFDAIPKRSNVQTIDDFTPGSDKIILDSSVFRSLSAGSSGQAVELDDAFFEIAARADDRDDYIIYKWKTGAVYYDPDGRGGQTQIQIAQLDDRLSLESSDFMII